MVNMVFFRCFVSFYLLVQVAFAQTKTVEFSDELCRYRGHYDSRKFTEKQLLSTYRIVGMGYSIDDRGTSAELTARYESTIREVRAIDVVEDTYFKKLKADMLAYLKQTYTLKKIEKNARTKPEDLIAAVQKDSKAWYYAQALNNGGEQLLKVYEELVKSKMVDNAWPENLWNTYLENMSKDNRLDLAFDYVLVYGWWNSANSLVDHVVYDGTQMKNFLALFIKVDTLNCDEP
ncbi:hypothetical protein [Sphingobacterium paludis]|uniref:Uncharacterized protein n=1 Tax=Sphingobacterium paludis TaxID=1476465 RepID=A0A4R7CWK8_9SPHI|nr:hypothetical protein [Sphingobacterium paludis]TDS12232.1 hypothetical protein B0I21_10687 [Sphingobacterium paludis]